MPESINAAFLEGYTVGERKNSDDRTAYYPKEWAGNTRRIYSKARKGRISMSPEHAARCVGKEAGGIKYCLDKGNPMGAAGKFLNLRLTYEAAIKERDDELVNCLDEIFQRNSPAILEGLSREDSQASRRLEKRVSRMLSSLNYN